MKRMRYFAIALVLLLVAAGCSNESGSGTMGDSQSSTRSTERSVPVEDELPWNVAKARALAMQAEIADLIPEEQVDEIVHKRTGTLLNCGGGQINWHSSSSVSLAAGVDEESVVRAIEEHYQGSRFDVETDIDAAGDYRIQLRSQDSAEGYIVVKDGPGTIRIASGSFCFVLPEDVDLPGDF